MEILTHDINTITEAVLLKRKMVMNPPQKWTIGKAFFQQMKDEIIQMGKDNGLSFTQEQAQESLLKHNYTTDTIVVYRDKNLDDSKKAETEVENIQDGKVKERVEVIIDTIGNFIDIPVDVPFKAFAGKDGQTVTIRISVNFKPEIK